MAIGTRRGNIQQNHHYRARIDGQCLCAVGLSGRRNSARSRARSKKLMMNSSILPSETEAQLRNLIAETFDSAAQISHYKILNQHPDYYALSVTLKHPALELAVKLAGRDAP